MIDNTIVIYLHLFSQIFYYIFSYFPIFAPVKALISFEFILPGLPLNLL